jgi:hypothetical protein
MDFKDRIQQLMTEEKACENTLETEKQKTAAYKEKRAQVDAASIRFGADKKARYADVVQDVLTNPDPDFLHLFEWIFKPAQAEALLEKLSQDLVENILPTQEERELEATISLYGVRRKISQTMEEACQEQLQRALEPLAAQHGTIFGGIMGVHGEISSELLEQLRAETANASRLYYGALDGLKLMRERRAKIEQARAAFGVIGRAQVHHTVPSY